MPRTTISYNDTIIYKICCKNPAIEDIYVGHTTHFRGRKAEHKYACLNEGNGKFDLLVYRFIRENGGWENWDMIEIEKYPCNDSNEAKARERFFIETLKASLNMILPSRTKEEYQKLHNEEMRNKTKEKLLIKQKYEEEHKEEIEMLKQQTLMERKQRIRDNRRNKYERNEAVLKLKHKCECGGCYTTANFLIHSKTTKHIQYCESSSLQAGHYILDKPT